MPQKQAVVKTRKAPKKAAAKKTTAKTKVVAAPAQTQRKRKNPKYQSFKLSRRLPHPAGQLPSVMVLMRKTKKLLLANKKALFFVLVIYAALYMVLVRGLTAPVDVGGIRDSLDEALGRSADKGTVTSAIFAALLGATTSQSSESAGTYQAFLLVGLSLAVVWIFRQSAAGNKPTAKGALYLGMYPLVPFMLVLGVMSLQTLPVLLAMFIFSIVITGGIAATGIEQGLWYVLFGGLFILSFYMLLSSFFALYVVTLPEMTPFKALRSARNLVFSRRLNIARKLLFLPLIMLLVLIIVVVPAIYFIPVVAPWLYFVLSLFGLLYLHAFLFTMYRELL